jgi:hypothetical protein
VAHRHVDVGAQELDVVADRFRDVAANARKRVQRIVHLVLLEVDAREPIRGFVANFVIDVGFEHRLDRTTRAVVHAVVELEVANVELRVANVENGVVEARFVEAVVLAELRVEPRQRVEELPLVGMVERFRRNAGRAGLEPRRAPQPPRARWQCPVHGSVRESRVSPVADLDRGATRFGPDTVSPTSFGPTALLNVNWSLRLKSARTWTLPST